MYDNCTTWLELFNGLNLQIAESLKNTHRTMMASSVEKSPNDERTYRAITLDNGLKIVVVHDATSDTAAAAVNVRALFHERVCECESVSVVVPRVVPLARVTSASHAFPHTPCQPLTYRSK